MIDEKGFRLALGLHPSVDSMVVTTIRQCLRWVEDFEARSERQSRFKDFVKWQFHGDIAAAEMALSYCFAAGFIEADETIRLPKLTEKGRESLAWCRTIFKETGNVR